mgnify:FL=1
MVTGEQTSNGDDFTITAGFRVYHNYTECINDRAVLLTDVYSDLIAGVTDAKEFAQQMGSRWATDIRYAEKLINHMDNFNLYRLDTMTVEDYEEYQNSHSDPGEATEIQLRICEIAKKQSGNNSMHTRHVCCMGFWCLSSGRFTLPNRKCHRFLEQVEKFWLNK